MTKEQIKRVEELRNQLDSTTAHALNSIAKHHGGPLVTNYGCFCKQNNIVTYISAFYNWFDGLQNFSGSDDE